MSSILSLTSDDVRKAVEQTQACMNITEGKLVPLTEDLYPATLKVLEECFIDDEPLGKAVECVWNEDFVELFMSAFKENLSIVLINENREVIGVRIIKSLKRGVNEGRIDVTKLEEGPIKVLVTLFEFSVEKASFWENYEDADEVFQFWGLCVARQYRRRGIGTLLMRAALKFTECLGFESIYIRGAASSNYSKRIYEKLGFTTLSETEYDSYKVDGNFVIRGKTGEHKSVKEYVLKQATNRQLLKHYNKNAVLDS